MIRVSLADDHQVVLKGLNVMLDSSDDIRVQNVFNNSDDLLASLEHKEPDVLLLDINFGDASGIELCKMISKSNPEVRIIGLTSYDESNYVKNMMRSGARGYLLKDTSRDELFSAIRSVALRNVYIPLKLQNKLLNDTLVVDATSKYIPSLTKREREVLECIADELTNNEIANKLFISIKTVESHRNNLLHKFGARNTAGLIKKAFLKGLL